nr:hypothetical protein [Tanacetum cinerariifolium]
MVAALCRNLFDGLMAEVEAEAEAEAMRVEAVEVVVVVVVEALKLSMINVTEVHIFPSKRVHRHLLLRIFLQEPKLNFTRYTQELELELETRQKEGLENKVGTVKLTGLDHLA